MCIQDLMLGRHKYTRYSSPGDATGGKQRPGTASSIATLWGDNSEPQLLIGPNMNRTALRAVMQPNMVFNGEGGGWVFFDTLVLGLPIPAGISDLRTISLPLYAMFALSTNTRLESTITIEEVGNLIYGSWGFFTLSANINADFGGLTVWDIQADKEVMALAQESIGDIG